MGLFGVGLDNEFVWCGVGQLVCLVWGWTMGLFGVELDNWFVWSGVCLVIGLVWSRRLVTEAV